MNIDTTNTDLFRRYLLDGLTEDECGAVEERVLTDDAAYDEMLATEDELFYEYKQNELDAGERRIFERKFLRTREDREKAAFAGAFLDATADMAREQSLAPIRIVEERPTLLHSIAAFFSFSGSAMQFGIAAAALLLVIGIIGLLIQNSRMRNEVASIQQQNEAERLERQTQLAEKQKEQQEIENQLAAEREKNGGSEERIKQLESERSKLETEIRDRRRRIEETPNVRQSPGTGTLATLIISPGHFTRSDGQPMNHIVLTDSIRGLKLGLTLKNFDEYGKFGVTVKAVDSGNTILTRSNLAPVGKGSNRTLNLNIPARSLQRADYEVILTGLNKTGSYEDITKYYFSVDK